MAGRSAIRKDLEATWRAAWSRALAGWSPYTLLREPEFLASKRAAARSGMSGEIAAIRLRDQRVMVNLETVEAQGLQDLALPVLAHEVGHHVYVPGNLADNARMIAAMKPMLFGLPADVVHLAANLYGDLLINDRLERRAGIPVSAVYRKLKEAQDREGGGAESRVWKVYTRAYEHLWRLAAGTLSPDGLTPEMDADAALVARLVRHYAGEWLRGARRFACILYPHFQADAEDRRAQTFVSSGLEDMRRAASGEKGAADTEAIPDGLTGIDPAELGEDPDFDREIEDPLAEVEDEEGANARGRLRRPVRTPRNTAPDREGKGSPGSQHREPFEYGEILRALGLDLSEHEITTRYYRERALPHLIPFPVERAPRAVEPFPEGYESWEPADDIEALDLSGSILRSPVLVPGVTTVRRVHGEAPGSDPAKVPVDLDVYVDCSGSMPNPAVTVSYLALAAAILSLSALRAGARVQATLWSGAGQFETTGGFIRDEKRILGIVTGYIAGATAFPLHILRDTYAARKSADPPAHIVVISDTGIDTILGSDDKGAAGKGICERALRDARGGGTLVLNLPGGTWPLVADLEAIGFRVHAVSDWEGLVEFARRFVRENYES